MRWTVNDSDRSFASLKGQVALVTGGAQGLGLAIAGQLAQCGASVVIADLQKEKAESAAAELSRKGLAVEASVLDIADSSAVNQSLTALAEARGKLDIVVNNAGVGQTVAPVV
jgi:NAD(P)-dependent dehydrogenase (short-subunit alcohol dehydrogenase family)